MSDTLTDEDFNDDPDLEPDDTDNDLIKNLRKRAKDGAKAAKRAAQLETENASLKSEKLLRTAGLDQLNERQQRAVLGSTEGEVTVESLKQAAVELGFIEADKEGAQADAAQRAMAEAAAGTRTSSSEFLTMDEFRSWDMPRRVDFETRHPEKFAALGRGESVRV